jgi:hypothetical protein
MKNTSGDASILSFVRTAMIAPILVAFGSINACSESIEGDLSSRAPRGSTINQVGKEPGNDHSDCGTQPVQEQAQGKKPNKANLKEDLGAGQVKKESCDASATKTGNQTGTSTGKKVADVTRPSGATDDDSSPSSMPGPTSTSTSTSTGTGLGLTGAQLYATECQRCHGPGTSYSLNKTSQAIRAAINNRRPMRIPQLTNLTDSQLQQISAYLVTP